jgi:hypothetical protein
MPYLKLGKVCAPTTPNACNTYKNTAKQTTTFITVLIFESIGTNVFNKYNPTPTKTKTIKREINIRILAANVNHLLTTYWISYVLFIFVYQV